MIWESSSHSRADDQESSSDINADGLREFQLFESWWFKRVQVLSASITESSGKLRADVYESSVSRNLTCLCDLLANYGFVIYWEVPAQSMPMSALNRNCKVKQLQDVQFYG